MSNLSTYYCEKEVYDGQKVALNDMAYREKLFTTYNSQLLRDEYNKLDNNGGNG